MKFLQVKASACTTLAVLVLLSLPAAGVDWKRILKPGSEPVEQVRTEGAVFFTFRHEDRAGLELWQKVRSPPGAVKLVDLPAGARNLTAAGGLLFFISGEREKGLQLFRTDKTPVGTTMVRKFPPWTELAEFTYADGTLFFTNDVPGGKKRFELWKSDGTEKGTVAVKDIHPGVGVPKARILAAGGPAISIFTLDYRVICHGGATYAPRIRRMQIWHSDGTAKGTRVIQKFKTKASISEQFRILGHTPGRLFYVYDTRWDGSQLFRSDGTRQGTVLVKTLKESRPFYGVLTGETLFFYARLKNDIEIWKSDGTDEGTVMLKRIATAESVRYKKIVSAMTAPCGTLFVVAQTKSPGTWELWTSDGTEKGTAMLLDINSPVLDVGGRNRQISVLGCFDNKAFVRVDSQVRGSSPERKEPRQISELLATDGTKAGTSLIWHH